MTKKVAPDLPEHIGIRLDRAYAVWRSRFIAAMNAAGHTWFTPSRAHVMGCLDREGTRQNTLLERTGLTKQALQQTLDGLERHKVITRTVDPADRRGRLIDLTPIGHQALHDADRIKADIEAEFARQLGEDKVASLADLLAQFAQTDRAP